MMFVSACPCWTIVLAAFFGALIVAHRLTAKSQNATVLMLRLVASALVIRLFATPWRLFQRLTGTSVPPASLDDLTKEWLTATLTEAGVLSGNQSVASFETKEFDVGKTSKSARVKLTYVGESADLPASVVVKCTRLDVEGRILNLVLKLYREGLFYNTLAKESPLVMPTCHYSFTDSLTCDFIMILEDINPGEMIADPEEIKPFAEKLDNSWGLAVEDVEGLCTMITKQHVKYEGNKTVTELANKYPWLLFSAYHSSGRANMAEANLTHKLFVDSWAKSKTAAAKGEWIGTPWSPKLISIIETTLDMDLEFLRDNLDILAPATVPFTLCHQDFHMWNVLKVPSGGKVLLDFQVCGFALPQIDYAYMIALGLKPEDRRVHERRLSKACWEAHVSQCKGVDASLYTEELAFELYKLCGGLKVAYLIMLIGSLMADGREDDAYMPPYLMLRLLDFVKDHGSPQENWGRIKTMVALLPAPKKA